MLKSKGNHLYLKSDVNTMSNNLYTFESKNYNQSRKHNVVSYKNIKLTNHAIDRARERFNINSKDELKKLAASAKSKGIAYWGLTTDNISQIGVPYEVFVTLNRTIKSRLKSKNKIYIYKNKIFIFANNGITLLTCFPLTVEDVEKYGKLDTRYDGTSIFIDGRIAKIEKDRDEGNWL